MSQSWIALSNTYGVWSRARRRCEVIKLERIVSQNSVMQSFGRRPCVKSDDNDLIRSEATARYRFKTLKVEINTDRYLPPSHSIDAPANRIEPCKLYRVFSVASQFPRELSRRRTQCSAYRLNICGSGMLICWRRNSVRARSLDQDSLSVQFCR